jgi:hypothetical protein
MRGAADRLQKRTNAPAHDGQGLAVILDRRGNGLEQGDAITRRIMSGSLATGFRPAASAGESRNSPVFVKALFGPVVPLGGSRPSCNGTAKALFQEGLR